MRIFKDIRSKKTIERERKAIARRVYIVRHNIVVSRMEIIDMRNRISKCRSLGVSDRDSERRLAIAERRLRENMALLDNPNPMNVRALNTTRYNEANTELRRITRLIKDLILRRDLMSELMGLYNERDAVLERIADIESEIAEGVRRFKF